MDETSSTLSTCVTHGLKYDPTVHSGCVLCRKSGARIQKNVGNIEQQSVMAKIIAVVLPVFALAILTYFSPLVGMGLWICILIGAVIWFLIQAFRVSVLWGLGCIFLPILPLIFFILNFQETRKPFALAGLGTIGLLQIYQSDPSTWPPPHIGASHLGLISASRSMKIMLTSTGLSLKTNVYHASQKANLEVPAPLPFSFEVQQ